MWALLADHFTVRQFDPQAMRWRSSLVSNTALAGVVGVGPNNALSLLSEDRKLLTVDPAAGAWQVRLDLPACAATYDDQGNLWYSVRTCGTASAKSVRTANDHCSTLRVCPPQLQQTSKDLRNCQQVYDGSVQSFAVNAPDEGAAEVWVVDGQGQVLHSGWLTHGRALPRPSPPLAATPSPSPSTPPSPLPIPPSPVSDAAVTQLGNTLVISFTLPTEAGSSPITGYAVVAVPAPGSPGSPANVTLTATSSPAVLEGLQDGVTYTVYVAAQSAAGSSAQVQAGDPISYQTATPSAPTSLTVTDTGLVSFTYPASNGASCIEGYDVVAVPASGGANVTVSGVGLPLQLGGLADGETYTLYAFATNLNGTSSASDPVVFTALLAPAIPAGLYISADTGLVTFNASESSGASPIDSYTIVAVPDGGGTNLTVSGNSTSLQLEGLVDGETYTIYVYAQNANATSPASDSEVFTAHFLPDTPTIASPPAATGLVSFVASASPGASPIQGYLVVAIPASGGANITVQGSSPPLQLRGLQQGETYTAYVFAINANGTSPAAGPVSFTADVLPGPPTDVSAFPNGTVVFTIPDETGASPITQYIVVAVPVAGSPGTAHNVTMTITTASFELSGLAQGVTYTLYIAAQNDDGTSTAAESGSFTYAGSAHGFCDAVILTLPAHVAGTTVGSRNVVNTNYFCFIGNPSGMNEAIRGPQMFYAFKETTGTTRHINSCGSDFDTQLIMYSSTLAPDELDCANPLNSLAFMLCDDDDGELCTGGNVYTSPSWQTPGNAGHLMSTASFTTTRDMWYYVVFGDYTGYTGGRDFTFNAY
ncbi:hypothetical protein N2152v2_011164 [Parachlorella kessleri]